MAWDPDFETYAGTRLFVTRNRPSDNTEVLFEGAAWNEITVTSVGNYRGRTFSSATLSVVSSGRDAEKKGSYTYGSIDFGIQWLPDQEGQIVAQELLNSYDIGGFAVVDQNGGVSYFSAQVSALVESGGGSNDARSGTLTLMRQSDTIDALTPAVPAEAV